MKKVEVHGLHNGHAGADATEADFTVFSKLHLGTDFDVSISVSLQGAGATQEMCLTVESTETEGVDINFSRADL